MADLEARAREWIRTNTDNIETGVQSLLALLESVREEAKKEQRETDVAICGNAADIFAIPRVHPISAFDAAMACKVAIEEAKR